MYVIDLPKMPRKKAATKKAAKSKKDEADEPMNDDSSGRGPPPSGGPAVEDLLSKLPENRFELEVSLLLMFNGSLLRPLLCIVPVLAF